jgi:hypothetical protein
LSAQADQRRVPGIDSLPAAQADAVNRDSKTEPAKTQPTQPTQPSQPTQPTQPTQPAQPTQPTQPAKVETEPTKPAPPADVIKRLTIEKDKEHPYSARLTWEVDPANDTEIYVARFVRPPATRQLILESENLTTPPLGPKETTFLDRNMPEGSYYYAIVTGYQMSKKGTLSLKADENYTTRPFIIQRGHPTEDTKIQTPPTNPIQPVTQGPQVQGLSAVSAESSVKLNWTAPAASRVVFNVYRGTGAFLA